jgi:hypothetical protein
MKNQDVFVIIALLAVILLMNFMIFLDGSAAQKMLAKIAIDKPAKTTLCTTIQDGLLHTTDNELINTGYSEWGYNYQGHMFNGMYCDYHPTYRPGGAEHELCQANYGNNILMMKWNDAWLSNKDCDDDGLLDRHLGYDTYIGSGAWLTNHERGIYEGDDKSCSWNYFVKIVAAPSDAIREGNMWYMADDTELGEVIWGSFAIIQSIYNDTCAGEHGVEYLSPAGPGFGKF